MKHFGLAVAMSVVILTGCAHSMMRGTVAMKTAPDEAHVCLGEGEVKTGDIVAFFENRCQGGGGRDSAGRECILTKVGEGKVSQLLNDHYSVIKANPGVKFDEGTLVEKL